MADIDSIISGVGGNTRADFSGSLSGPMDAYWAGQDQSFKKRQRDVFKEGIPTNADGSPNYSEAAKKLYQLGDVGQGNAMANLDIQRQQLTLGQEASRALGNIEGGGSGAPISVPNVGPVNLPPSTSRTNGVQVQPSREAAAPPQAAPAPGGQYKGGDAPGSIVGLVSAAGVPDELAGPIIQQVSAMTRSDPNAPINPEMTPRVQQIIQAAAQRARGGQPQPQPQQAPQIAAPQPQSDAPLPVPNTRGSLPTGNDPQIQQRAAQYTQIMSNPAFPQSVRDAAKMRLEALQGNSSLTPTQKEYAQAQQQGYKGSLQDFVAETERSKTAATEEAKLGAKKYEGLVENGVKAQQEIPQLEMLQQQMNDPNFFSGAGEKYNLLYKRLKSAVGIDKDASVPQEFLRKATAANVLAGLGALKGLGQIRVAEINMAREASAAPENSIPANKLLIEISKRSHERNAEIAELAQDYKEKNGTLDAGFDKRVTALYKKKPMFSDAEIKDWRKAIGENAPTKATPAGGAQQRFASPSDVHAAISAGRLKKGDTFTDPNGVQRMVP